MRFLRRVQCPFSPRNPRKSSSTKSRKTKSQNSQRKRKARGIFLCLLLSLMDEEKEEEKEEELFSCTFRFRIMEIAVESLSSCNESIRTTMRLRCTFWDFGTIRDNLGEFDEFGAFTLFS